MQSNSPVKRSVLVLEDNPATRCLMSRALQMGGFDAFEALGIDDAAFHLDQHPGPFTAAVLDLRESERLEAFIDALRFHSPDVAILLCTSGDFDLAKQELLSRFRLPALFRPFSARHLVAAVEGAIRSRCDESVPSAEGVSR